MFNTFSAYSFSLGVSWLPVLAFISLLFLLFFLFTQGKSINLIISQPGIKFVSYIYSFLFATSLLLSPLSIKTDWIQVFGFFISLSLIFTFNSIYKYVDLLMSPSLSLRRILYSLALTLSLCLIIILTLFPFFPKRVQNSLAISHLFDLFNALWIVYEPGTFSTYIAPLLFSLLPHQRSSRVKIIINLSLFCLVLSLSTYGLLIIFLYFLFSNLPKLQSIPLKIKITSSNLFKFLLLAVATSVPLYLSARYFLRRFIGNASSVATDTGILYRFSWMSDNVSNFTNNYSLWPFFGPGYFEDTSVAFDLSLLIHTIFFYGFIPFVVIIFSLILLFAKISAFNRLDIWAKYSLLGLSASVLLTKFNIYNIAATSLLVISLSTLLSKSNDPPSIIIEKS